MTLQENDKYINPYTDFGFKRLFGTEINKELLVSFVNALLCGKEVIHEVTYLNTEHLGVTERDRKAVFDLYCDTERGEKILIEMQRGEQQFFKDRSLYYSTFPIREQGRKGEWDYELKAVYVIGILNFTFDSGTEGCTSYVKLMDTERLTVFYDKLTFIYLEMPKFNKREDELETLMDKWLYVLRNLTRLLSRPKALQERIFTKLFEAAEIARFSRAEFDAYEESLKVYRDWQNTIRTAELKAERKGREEGRAEGLRKGRAEGREKGLAEGREKGLAEGREEERLQNARRMKAEGIAVEVIARITGLDAGKIEAL